MSIFRIFQAALGLSLTTAGLPAQPLKFDLVERHQIVVRGSIGNTPEPQVPH